MTCSTVTDLAGCEHCHRLRQTVRCNGNNTMPSSWSSSSSKTIGNRLVRIVTLLLVMNLMNSLLNSCDVEAISLAPVHWNMSNPMFKTSKNDHVIEVKLYDDIDFVCPFYQTATDSQHNSNAMAAASTSHYHGSHHHQEYYIVYLVSRSEYNDCNIYDESNAVMLLNCSNPRQRKRFTILFEPFQSIPNAPEYHQGQTYYFITTSTGTRHGMSNLYQGACMFRNMKLTVRVCCQTTQATKLQHHHQKPMVTAAAAPANGHRHNVAVQLNTTATTTTSPSSQGPRYVHQQPSHVSTTTTRPDVVPTPSVSSRNGNNAEKVNGIRFLPSETSGINDVNNLIDDISSIKQAELVTSLAAKTRKPLSSYSNFCVLSTVLLTHFLLLT